jgi:hypothetical protein
LVEPGPLDLRDGHARDGVVDPTLSFGRHFEKLLDTVIHPASAESVLVRIKYPS